MEKHKLDQLFSDRLEDLQVAPNNDTWSQISETLDKREKRPIWTWMAVAASALLTVFSSYYFLVEGVDNEVPGYAYHTDKVDAQEIPEKLIYVPVFIQQTPVVQTPVVKTIVNQYQPSAQQVAAVAKPAEAIEREPSIQEINDQNITKIAAVEIIPNTEEEVLMASAIDMPNAEPEQKQLPVTIIYKQGEPEEESNFTKALNYMEDVRMGEKKLVDFQKLRNNIKSKLKTNKDVNSK